MADPAKTNSASGSSALATVTATFGFTATAGRLLVVAVSADDYKTGDPSGYTLSTGAAQQAYLGHYVWWRIAAGGETSVQYSLGGAAPSAWVVAEYSNIEASGSLDVSGGQISTVSNNVYTTPAVTPSTGARFAIASMAAMTATASTFTGMDTWLNSYVEDAESINNTGASREIVGLASLVLTGNGSSTTSGGATVPGISADCLSGIVLVFKAAAGGGSPNNQRGTTLGAG